MGRVCLGHGWMRKSILPFFHQVIAFWGMEERNNLTARQKDNKDATEEATGSKDPKNEITSRKFKFC